MNQPRAIPSPRAPAQVSFSVSSFAANAAADGFPSATAYAQRTVAKLSAGPPAQLWSLLNQLLGGGSSAVTGVAIAPDGAPRAFSVMEFTVPYRGSAPGQIRNQFDALVR